MAKKPVTTKQKKQPVKEIKETPESSNFFDYFRFGESYTSLILGIIVVIIATALLLSFVHNKNAGNVNAPISEQTQNTVQVSQQASEMARKAPSNAADNANVALTPTQAIVPTTPVKPTEPIKPTVPVKPTQPAAPTMKPQPTHAPKVIAMGNHVKRMHPTRTKRVVISSQRTAVSRHSKIWVVQKNESLWIIAEQAYGSGYNWTDIAKANNLAVPSDIHVGDRLVLPNIAPKQTTIAASKPSVTTNDEQFSSTKQTNTQVAANAITGTTYTVEHGDNLWNIAVRAYGNGYRWTAIAQANNLANPHMIFSGNVLTIPR